MAISRKQTSCFLFSLWIFIIFFVDGTDVASHQDHEMRDKSIPNAKEGRQDFNVPATPDGDTEMGHAESSHVNDPGGQTSVLRLEDNAGITNGEKEEKPGSCVAMGMEKFLTDVLGKPLQCESGSGGNSPIDSAPTCSKRTVYGKIVEEQDMSAIGESTADVRTSEGKSSEKTVENSFVNGLINTAMRSLRSYKQFLYDVLQELKNLNGNKTVTSEHTPSTSKDETKSTEAVIYNATSANINFTDSTRKKIHCVGRNTTENTTAEVHIVDSVILHEKLNPKNSTEGACTLVMFYAPWCVFCARTAPHYNALARAFPQMDILAIDAVHFSSLNARYGTIAVPNIMMFHGGRPVTRFNLTERTLEKFVAFVANATGFKPVPDINVTEADFKGPLPSVPTDYPDYLLALAWVFVISCVTYMVVKSNSGQQLWQKVQHLWLEHQHLD